MTKPLIPLTSSEVNGIYFAGTLKKENIKDNQYVLRPPLLNFHLS